MGFCAYIGISGRFYGDFSMGAQAHCEIPIFARNPEKRGIMGGPKNVNRDEQNSNKGGDQLIGQQLN